MSPPEVGSNSAWRDGRFRVFALGNGINTVGESMYALAIPLLAFELTGSLTSMALLAAAYPLVLAVGGPFLGAAVDRFGSKWLVLPGLAVEIVAALALNIVLLLGRQPSITFLFAVEIVVQLGAIAYRAGWMAGIPAMFPDNVARSRGALLTTFQAAVVTGPALAAVLLGPLGIEGLLWFNVATFLPPILVWFAGINPVAAQVRGRTVGWSVLADLCDGWRIFRQSQQPYIVVLVLAPLNIAFGTGTVALAVFHLRDNLSLSERGVGAVIAAANVAALLGAAFVSERPRRSLGNVCVVGLLGTGACLFLVPATPYVALAAVALVLIYLLNTCVEVAADMVIYAGLPPEAVGRSLGFYRLILGTAAFLGPLLISAVSAILGPDAAFVALGLVALVPGLVLLLWRDRFYAQPRRAAQLPVPAETSPRP